MIFHMEYGPIKNECFKLMIRILYVLGSISKPLNQASESISEIITDHTIYSDHFIN